MPCPISTCGMVKVTLPSWSMRMKAFGAKSALVSAAKAGASRGMETPSMKPPPATTVALTIARRVNVRVDEDRVMGKPPSGRTRGLLDGGADAHVGAAAANVSGHRRVDVSIVRVGRFREQRGGGHDLSGLAVAALHDFEVEPGLLDLASRLASRRSPSMVVTLRSPIEPTGSRQERTGSPSICTVQAPHCAIPQPNLVPVRPITSRKVQSSGVSGATSTVSRSPLISMVIDMLVLPSRSGSSGPR